MTHPDRAIAELREAGVSLWLDDLSRERLRSGSLRALVERGVSGVTTNPTIFQQALSQGTAYDEQIRGLARRGVGGEEAVRLLTTWDVRAGCDVLAETHRETAGLDGLVSLEVDPRIAQDALATGAEAETLAWMVDRPNLLVKIPATRASLPAITSVLGRGISVNVTLIFTLSRYEAVLEAWTAGMEEALTNGHDVSQMSSVASFFVSRVDTACDPLLQAIIDDESRTAPVREAARSLLGEAAIANARLAHEIWTRHLQSPRVQALSQAGVRPQRLLWASTGVKNEAYRDTRYIEELVGEGSVNTAPEKTIEAMCAHGQVRPRAIEEYDSAREVIAGLTELGLDLEAVGTELEEKGVSSFTNAWSELLTTVEDQLRRQ